MPTNYVKNGFTDDLRAIPSWSLLRLFPRDRVHVLSALEILLPFPSTHCPKRMPSLGGDFGRRDGESLTVGDCLCGSNGPFRWSLRPLDFPLMDHADEEAGTMFPRNGRIGSVRIRRSGKGRFGGNPRLFEPLDGKGMAETQIPALRPGQPKGGVRFLKSRRNDLQNGGAVVQGCGLSVR